jgi:hypothetical protein
MIKILDVKILKYVKLITICLQYFNINSIKSIESRAVESQSESEGILGGVGVGKNVPTPTPTSV